MNKNMVVLNKEVGETPLECLERFRAAQIQAGDTGFVDIPMTYAGRLDPMASGRLIVLWGDECKKKEVYLGLEKEYEVEILFGVVTDTHDILGVIKKVANEGSAHLSEINFTNYTGKYAEPYPAYSSKAMDGVQLHMHARNGTLPHRNEMPTHNVEVYSIEEIGRRVVTAEEIAADALVRISKVNGDFRQEKISAGWQDFAGKNSSFSPVGFAIYKIRVNCGSGTYMRMLAERIGNDVGTGAIAFSICRTKIGEF